ncbi:MAG: RNA-binding transcriptional accessory protein [Anaerolineales bacterium]|nr:RNA-binding transcriptional accessory protein [Anaerolineales bacterium]
MIEKKLASELKLRPDQVSNAIQLLDDGNTIPFIARYRKETTGGMDEVQLRQLSDRLTYQRNLADRKETVLRTIEEQGKLTPELFTAIHDAETLQVVEDLYLPYKPKRRTRATIARQRGLEPLATLILEQPVKLKSLGQVAQPFITGDVPTTDDAWAGARDIVAEIVSDNAGVRARIRNIFQKEGYVQVSVADVSNDPKGIYRLYYEFGVHNRFLKPHQILAIDRGEQDKVLKIEIQEPLDQALSAVRSSYPANPRSPLRQEILAATEDAYQRLVRPAIDREFRRKWTEMAGEHAINVFSTNLRNLLLAPPLRGQTILAIDPGFRTGSKVALINPTGAVLDTTTIYPHKPQGQWEQSKKLLIHLIRKHNVTLITIGNGTASRETEQLAAEIIQQEKIQYLVVSEAGASVYSAMPLARQELPGLDVSIRGAVSIGRRVLDPLAELVKIDPKAIGVGMYQHDVDQKQLALALDSVVESAVNHVGVNLNTASPALLRYVSGLGPTTAAAIVAHRDEQGPFKNRKALLKVKGIGPKAFEQAAGFLRIPDGDNPLDNTAVHPESYPVVEQLASMLKKEKSKQKTGKRGWENIDEMVKSYRRHFTNLEELAKQLNVGKITLVDILNELEKPGRDPRDELPAPILRSDVLSLEDIKPGMQLHGTVRNVVDFGAFVDIGVKQDGLVHISEMSDQRVRDPYAILSVGDVVEVSVLDVDIERGRISLSLRR